jgi:hypothetical protein
MKIIYLIVALLVPLAAPGFAAQNVDPSNDMVELEWIDLIPEGERNRIQELSAQVLEHTGDTATQSSVGDIRSELAGSKVKIPGFVIPLEGDSETITEFLLVPFYGACIHVPPPPPNQIIHVKFEKGAPVQELWDVVYITGTLKAETLVSHDLGVESGYSINGASIEVYNEA